MSKINKQVGAFLPSKEIVKLDKKNQKLISLLLQDATQTLTELSKELNISKSNVSRRISLLEKQSVINGYHRCFKIRVKLRIIIITN